MLLEQLKWVPVKNLENYVPFQFKARDCYSLARFLVATSDARVSPSDFVFYPSTPIFYSLLAGMIPIPKLPLNRLYAGWPDPSRSLLFGTQTTACELLELHSYPLSSSHTLQCTTQVLLDS